MADKSWDDNLRRILIAFKWPISLAIVALCFYLGWIDVPVFESIVDGAVRFAQALVPSTP